MTIDRDEARAMAFERQLLESARADDPPHGVDQAWARLAGTLASIDVGTAIGDAPRGGEARTPASAESLAVPPAGVSAWTAIAAQSSRKVVMTWLLAGALGGGAVTAVTMTSRLAARISAQPPAAAVPAVAVPAVAVPAVGISNVAVPTTSAAGAGAEPTAAPAPRRHLRRRRDEGRFARGPRSVLFATARARLAAEVASLDAARAALAAGDCDDALWLIDRHHQDFPAGALAPDAEVVALDALVAKRDHSAVVRRASRFLARYPNDPHVARVEAMRRRHPDKQP